MTREQTIDKLQAYTQYSPPNAQALVDALISLDILKVENSQDTVDYVAATIIETGNESYTGQQLLAKLRAAGLKVVSIK